jgi:hypothetical protein
MGNSVELTSRPLGELREGGLGMGNRNVPTIEFRRFSIGHDFEAPRLRRDIRCD